MGLRFRKSVKIAPGVRVNFGKKSTGISIGTKGARISVNSKGRVTKSVGIPGTGVSFTSSSQIGKGKSQSAVKTSGTPLNYGAYPAEVDTSSMLWLLDLLLFVVGVVVALFGLLALLFSLKIGLYSFLIASAIIAVAVLFRNKLLSAEAPNDNPVFNEVSHIAEDKHSPNIVSENELTSKANEHHTSSPDEFHAKWNNPTVREHFANVEKIESQYSVLYNLKKLQGREANELIALCERDISLAKEFHDVFVRNHDNPPPNYGTFKRLAIIYEKRREYDNAIRVCVQSIKNGFVEDGTAGKMHGRLARMIRLSGSDKPPEFYLEG